ncbi:DUF1848 domain-containing protein [Anaeromicropila herbilytica]|uniref:DUF1848 domain-containing protein n=1 Tax=Anaeromicropila herbilytica TaxID=2785025 RepID=A0A7R7EJ81_9FIRM|nr:DUF1848 domain-containing protein [Anaeromicropila herbilytica]BCN29760.1 hypothetical protein bsdtb5_10550 [Anaeromicropila herbilytica]
MILSPCGRTDTVQYYTPWLMKRLKEGYAYSRNPLFNNKVTKLDLTPENVDCIVFCSKNYKPLLPHLDWIEERYNTYYHYTITAYGKEIEPGVPSNEDSMDTLIQLSKIVGKNKIAWRYDPILFTKEYTLEKHLESFEYMTKRLAPNVDRCIFSFVEMYKKLETNMPEIIPFTDGDRKQIAEGIGSIVKKYGMYVQTCGTNGDYTEYGIHTSGCTTLDVLGNANGVQFKDVIHKGSRQGCHCIECRDIGAYDTCMNGCKYCYANKTPQKAFENYKLHDHESPIMLGHIQTGDTVQEGKARSFRK